MRKMSYLRKKGKKFWLKRAIFVPIGIAVGILIFGSVVMLLWNATLPTVFGVHTITFWQAVGILILSKVLFSGFHIRHGHHDFHQREKNIREKWMNLSPEEKEKMRKQWWGRFEHHVNLDHPENPQTKES
jgi:amino acid transporter